VRKSSFTRGRGSAGTPEDGGGEPPTIRDNNTASLTNLYIVFCGTSLKKSLEKLLVSGMGVSVLYILLKHMQYKYFTLMKYWFQQEYLKPSEVGSTVNQQQFW
jgi:hypothetical protein